MEVCLVHASILGVVQQIVAIYYDENWGQAVNIMEKAESQTDIYDNLLFIQLPITFTHDTSQAVHYSWQITVTWGSVKLNQIFIWPKNKHP